MGDEWRVMGDWSAVRYQQHMNKLFLVFDLYFRTNDVSYDVHYFTCKTHVQSKLFQDFYHYIVCIAKKGCHIRIEIIKEEETVAKVITLENLLNSKPSYQCNQCLFDCLFDGV
jgi:cytochrome c oxidase subunit IV